MKVKKASSQQVVARKQTQDQPVRICPLRIGPSQLHRHEICHGRDENCPVLRHQQSEIRANQRNAGKAHLCWVFFPANASLLHSSMFQDQLAFEDGFHFVVKALDIKVGIELR